MARCGIITLALVAASALSGAAAAPIVVTGATGRTGVLIYNMLKKDAFEVRAVVRNASKARALLGCDRCDESEGIFVGDVTDKASLAAPMRGAGSLVIATSSVPICDKSGCHFPPGGSPLEVDWVGARNQIEAYAGAARAPHRGFVALISTMGTTNPEGRLDKLGHITYYKLNFEAYLMGSSLPFAIIKPCGLANDEAGKKEIIIGHEDDILDVKPPLIARADVARLTVAALHNVRKARGLRFDVCSKAGRPTRQADLDRLLERARYPWDRRSAALDGAREVTLDAALIHPLRI